MIEFPEHRDSHASSSHEVSLGPTSKRSEDLVKHSVFSHFPKDRNFEICHRTKITRAPCRRRVGGAVPRAENFGDVITADHKVLSDNCESRNNHRCAVAFLRGTALCASASCTFTLKHNRCSNTFLTLYEIRQANARQRRTAQRAAAQTQHITRRKTQNKHSARDAQTLNTCNHIHRHRPVNVRVRLRHSVFVHLWPGVSGGRSGHNHTLAPVAEKAASQISCVRRAQ